MDKITRGGDERKGREFSGALKVLEKAEKTGRKTDALFLSRRIYKNYEHSMKTKNLKRKKDGLTSITIKTYEEWSGQSPKEAKEK